MTRRHLLSLALLVLLPLGALAQNGVRSPEQAFGFRPGADQKMVDWAQSTAYFEALAKSSDKVRVLQFGTTTMGKPMIAAAISARENLAAIDQHRATVGRLSDPRVTAPDVAEQLVAKTPVVVAIGCSVHASELGAAQMAPVLAYQLVTDDSAETRRILSNVILLLIPSLNPDGMDMVAEWYRQSIGKPWEGMDMPWLYNSYTGHDLNRDFFMLTQKENQALAQFLYTWHPQVYLSMHQMGQNGPRIFVPPLVDPIDRNYEPLIWREMGLLGDAMALALQSSGMKGVVTNAMYDYWIPGYDDSGPLGHNTVCLLSEVASARLASPATVRHEDLRGAGKGLPEYVAQENFPDPWPGGSWRLGDIIQYDQRAAMGLLGAAARYREDLLHNFYLMGRNQVEKGRAGSPWAFVIPASQRDPVTAAKMVNILRMGAVEVWRATAAFQANGSAYPAGSYVVPMEQPFRAYAKTLLEKQVYPVTRTAPGAQPERPYDVTGWTLPYQMGVNTIAIDRPFDVPHEVVDRASLPAAAVNLNGAALVLGAEINDSFMVVNRILKDGGRVLRATHDIETREGRVPAGAFVVPIDRARATRLADYLAATPLPARTLARLPGAGLVAVHRARVGLYRPWSANADEGWTRWLLEQYGFDYKTLRDADIRNGGLKQKFDAIILPSTRGNALIDGNRAGVLPAEYIGGIGSDGVEQLRQFATTGGVLVPLGQSARFAIERFGLPVRDVLQNLRPDAFFCPGSILRTQVDTQSPIAWGMPSESIAVFQSGSAFEVTGAFDGQQPRVVARYAGQDVLMSGWIQGENQLANQAAAVDVPTGQGHVILFGFGVQNRAQPHATFKLLFNALMSAATDVARSSPPEPQ